MRKNFTRFIVEMSRVLETYRFELKQMNALWAINVFWKVPCRIFGNKKKLLMRASVEIF